MNMLRGGSSPSIRIPSQSFVALKEARVEAHAFQGFVREGLFVWHMCMAYVLVARVCSSMVEH